MQRRGFVIAGSAGWLLSATAAKAHHGWSSFDPDRPLFLEGKASKVAWRNPHAELELDVAQPLRLPDDLKTRALPKQNTSIDGPALLAKTTLPTRQDRRWTIELAPLTRMQAWSVPEIKPGAALAVIGYAFAGEKGDAVLRAEYLFLDGKAYGLRSSPA